MLRANQLIGSLGQETERWEASQAGFTDNLHNVVGNILLSSAAIAYLGPLPQNYRNDLVRKWHAAIVSKNLPIIEHFSLKQILSNTQQVQEWQNCNLPSDELSTDNAIIMKSSRKECLLIDPDSQALNWLKAFYASLNIKILLQNDPRFLQTLEACLNYGEPVIINKFKDDFEPQIDALIRRAKYRRGSLNIQG